MNFEKSIQLLQGDCRSELGLRKIEKFESSQGSRIKKASYEPKDFVLRLYDLEMRFPVNPFKLDDTSYSRETPWTPPLSVTTTIMTMKKYFKENKDQLELFLKKLFIKEWDVSDDEVFNEEDFSIFRPYRSVMHYSHAIQNYNYSVLGQFGRKFLSNSVVENGIPIKTDTGFEVYQLELAIAKTRIAMFEETCKEGGENEHMSDDDKKAERKKIWKSMLVGNPYEKGVARCHDIPLTKEVRKNIKCDIIPDKSMEVLEKFDSDNAKENPLDDYARYFSCNGSELDKINQWINTEYDIYPDFILVTLYYPEDKSKGDDQVMIEAYTQRTFNNSPKISNLPENIKEIYRAYRDEYDLHYRESLMLESVYDFGAISDERNLEFYANELLASSKLNYITESIFKYNKALLERLGASIADQIQERILDCDDTNNIEKLAPSFEELEQGLIGDSDTPIDEDLGEEGEVNNNNEELDMEVSEDELFEETSDNDVETIIAD